MLLSLIRIPNKVGEGSMDTGCSKCPRGQNGAFGVPADQAGTAGADFSVEFIWNQKSSELTHTFCWISHHQFKLKSSQSPEHFNWLCFCAAEPGRARAARSLRYWADTKCPWDLEGMGVSAGKERQSCAQTYSVVSHGWLEAPPGQCTLSGFQVIFLFHSLEESRNEAGMLEIHLPLVESFMVPAGFQHLWYFSCHCQALNIARAVNGQRMTSPPRHSSGCTFPPHIKAWRSYPNKKSSDEVVSVQSSPHQLDLFTLPL